ncbi:MAG TPA: DUF1697 domain-containing protein [Gammaproteobacteria bacterium]|nr:DUF1697 domain-containing protein [Gammaproteobacteria bacterium]
MNTYIVLIRGINVGGRTLPMKDLVILLEDLGCHNVRTYIQSGNAVLQSNEKASDLTVSIVKAIKQHRGFSPSVLLLTRAELESAIAGNPFPEAEADPKALHYGFLSAVPSSLDLKRLDSLRMKSERCKLVNKVFYLHAPEGIGRSKLAANSERLLGVSMTDRNWRTVEKIRDMAKEISQ